MTRPVADSLNTNAADANHSPFTRNRGQASGTSEASNSEFSSLFAEESRSFRSRSTPNPEFGPADADPIGGLVDQSPRSPRSRESGGIPQIAATPRGTAIINPSGFVRSQSTEAPHLPRFESVPEVAKFPNGPYRQAPAESGGEWWMVNPFTGPEPWLRVEILQNGKPEETLPAGFKEIFGPRPARRQYPDNADFRLAKLQWEQDLKSFKRAGLPEGLDPALLEASEQVFQEWGLGKPAFYEGAHGWRMSFPGGAVPGFETGPEAALQAPHIVIAKYQIRMLQQGAVPETVHPWVPPQVLAAATEEA